MKKKTSMLLFFLFIILAFLAIFFVYSYYQFVHTEDLFRPEETISVANWNLQIFGDSKALS